MCHLFRNFLIEIWSYIQKQALKVAECSGSVFLGNSGKNLFLLTEKLGIPVSKYWHRFRFCFRKLGGRSKNLDIVAFMQTD